MFIATLNIETELYSSLIKFRAPILLIKPNYLTEKE